MKVKKSEDRYSELRDRAEALIAARSTGHTEPDAGTYEEMLHELMVYQTELEMQNDELRKAQEVIEESRTRYVDLYDFAPISYLTFDQHGHIIEANLTCCELLGTDRHNLKGKFFSRFIAQEDQDIFHRHCRQVLKTGDRQVCELILTKPDASRLYVSMESTEATSAHGPTIRSALTDISARKAMEHEREEMAARLRQAQKMEALGTMAGGIAHDFNNILAAIIGFTEMVGDHITKGGKDERNLKRVLQAAIRGRELVRHILTFSRHAEQEKKPVSLNTIIDESVRLLRASIPSTININIEVECESCLILADPIQIQQILLNLCGNAAHAMQEKGGLLEIRLSNVNINTSEALTYDIEAGPYVKLQISDTGTGIPAHIKERIFDPFFTTKSVGEGTGLGLAVVMGIVKQSGGHITVESEYGKGSTFTVYFPEITTEPAIDTASDKEVIPTGSERILFIDDEEALVEIGQEMLGKLGYDVTARMKSREALALFRLNPSRFDLVISDQTMPELTGIDLAREIVTIKPDTPIIMCTGFSDLVDATAAKAAGVKAFALKPLTKGELARTIRKVLDGKTSSKTHS